MDNWFAIGFLILFLPAVVAMFIAAVVAVWLMWAISISLVQDLWRYFVGR